MPGKPRPTIADVARQADVSVATVDRVLNRRAPVAKATARKVLQAAETVGFHAAALLKRRVEDSAPERILGFLLQKSSQSFYQALGAELVQATRASTAIQGKPVVQFLDDLTPHAVAQRLEEFGSRVDAVALVAADHPKVAAAIERLADRSVPVFTLLSDLTTPARAGFIGIDHRKAGRTAAWAVSRLAKHAGAVGIFVGSHRYIGHELSEISFRSYMREHAPAFQVLEPLASFEDVHFAHEATLDLLRRQPVLAGIYVAGGGIEGVIEALRELRGQNHVVVVCNELVPETRAALIDGVVDLVITTPLTTLSERTVAAMGAALNGQSGEQGRQIFLPFELHLSENI
jgi:LacI family transcriptional regulator